MTSEQFGQLALQLLAASTVPGNALDDAMAFKALASELAGGAAKIVQDEVT